MQAHDESPVLILGAGINGAAVARELTLNGVSVCVVEAHDIACGATSRSSRLIHGGLRYLEVGDIDLVRESLEERARLLRLAPQYVRPLRLSIPVRRRLGGLRAAPFRFLAGSRFRPLQRLAARVERPLERGLWVVHGGLSLYDRLAGRVQIEPHRVVPVSDTSAPAVDPEKYRWVCTYTDGQMRYPERFVVALLEDARRLAHENGCAFELFTHCRAMLDNGRAQVYRSDDDRVVHEVTPRVVVNATGAWGDWTLEELHVPAERLFGGTKGSHIVTYHRRLREMLGDGGVYAEAPDGRLVFVLPFGTGVLIGTTDEPFPRPPDEAVATEDELEYLLGMVGEVFPDLELTRDDVDLHYSGVRPLPYTVGQPPGAVPRGHWIKTHRTDGLSVLTLIGGKLTTCRAFGELVADDVLSLLDCRRERDTRDRPVPGGENHPPDEKALHEEWRRLTATSGLTVAQLRAVWELFGSRTESVLASPGVASTETLAGTDLPAGLVAWIIEHEWAATLEDLVERRLMLLYQPDLAETCLRQLAGYLVRAGRLQDSDVDVAVESTIDRLHGHYGKHVLRDAADATRSPDN